MTYPAKTLRTGSVLALAMLAVACAHAPTPHLSSAAPTQATAPAEIEAILALLDQGDQHAAKKRIGAALTRDPRNASLMLLRDSIERSPQELLGPHSFLYTTRQGDTMSGLAGRFLGNRLKSYQLARYNGIVRPAALSVGQVLHIPAEAEAEPLARRPERPTEPQPATAHARTVPPTRIAAASAPARRPAVPSANLAAAQRVRSAGLAALNEGQPGKAIGLLSQAAALDPGNSAIKRDLQRAQRIQATVLARK